MNRGLRGVDWIADERNVAISDGDDVILFDYERPGVYQFHWLASSRGRSAITRAKRALKTMFDEHGAEAIFGLVPVERPDVRLMARWLGAELADETPTQNGPCQIFIMTKDMHPGVVN